MAPTKVRESLAEAKKVLRDALEDQELRNSAKARDGRRESAKKERLPTAAAATERVLKPC